MCGVRKLTRAAYANQRMTLHVKLRQRFKAKAEYDDRATWVNPRGVFSSFMFLQGRLAMPHMRRGDWEHATLLFCARECRIGQRGKGSQE